MLLRIFTEPQQGATYDDLLAVAKKTEENGFDAFFRSDHYLVMGPNDGLPGPTDSWITLAGLARETSRIKLGTLVSSATFRNPGVLAIEVAQVDRMSGGRVEFGLGAGWYEAEHQAYGLEFPDTPGRFDRFTEQLELITGLWNTPVGEKYDFQGKHYQLSNSPALPKPAQQNLPIIIGGAGKKRTPALAAQYAAEFNAGFKTVEDTAVLFERVQAACTAIGRDPQTLALSTAHTVVVGKDDAQVKQRADAIGRDLDELKNNHIAGTPAEVVDRLGQFAAAGSQRQYVQIMDLADLDHLDLIAAEVLPQVR
ncbi:LLM class F420-dependent oxidoreductase [Kribbella sandramycini]|uniref:F420-dependent oxidoreductase-like protein n=1 Tax=Kribbella sandramycini TaxID=60450 RepID=A0A7Y4NYQ8_9ACTN|nr:LLM class F420-dependent oxidoreductase [Kribbella sandramycini]MBB6568932.1 F420-dependent oxidoreductase-like protein [Kribbella sandramycini]NOL41222.1 LLM class F420-dependent oxidoreductase [Kribbella sandramycini]